ncbi:MAG: hypothetical protein WC250_01200 [Candidatus Paceibacterota bacterium]|jgi:hypothetical protein
MKTVSASRCHALLNFARTIADRPELAEVIGNRPVSPLSKAQQDRLKRTESPSLKRLAQRAALSQDAVAGQGRLPLP